MTLASALDRSQRTSFKVARYRGAGKGSSETATTVAFQGLAGGAPDAAAGVKWYHGTPPPLGMFGLRPIGTLGELGWDGWLFLVYRARMLMMHWPPPEYSTRSPTPISEVSFIDATDRIEPFFAGVAGSISRWPLGSLDPILPNCFRGAETSPVRVLRRWAGPRC